MRLTPVGGFAVAAVAAGTMGCTFGLGSSASSPPLPPGSFCAGALPAPGPDRLLPDIRLVGEVPPEERIARMWYLGSGFGSGGAREDGSSAAGQILVDPSTLELEPMTVVRLLAHEMAHWQFHSLSHRHQSRLARQVFEAYGEDVLLSFARTIDRRGDPFLQHNYHRLRVQHGQGAAQRYLADEVIAWVVAFADLPIVGKQEERLRDMAHQLNEEGSLDLTDLSQDERKYVLLRAHGIDPCEPIPTLVEEYGFTRTREYLPGIYHALRDALEVRRTVLGSPH